MMIYSKDLHEMSKTLRMVALRALYGAQSGHIGIVLGAADIVTLVYAVLLNSSVDRFVLSAGHGSALLYSALKLSGYKIPDLSSFRRLGGLAGHPEFGTDGVDATTGPLGQGIANAVGQAIAAKHKNNGGRVFCLCSDGDLMEGVANEAIAFAGRYHLDNLVLFWDNNGVSIDGTAQTDVDVPMRMKAAGWTVCAVRGDDFDALFKATNTKTRGPLFIQCDTVLGRDTSVAGTPAAHGFGISGAEIANLIEYYKSPLGEKLWRQLAETHRDHSRTRCSVSLPNVVPSHPVFASTRELSGMFLEQIVKRNPRNLIGGSADLSSNTNVRSNWTRDITSGDFSGNFINYGVREHAMAAIMNGMAYAGLRAFGSSFLVFSDYMRGAMRLSALAGLPVVYVLTHDSIAVGQDGPTHQPVEQLAGLRLIPNMNVIRPCNMAEVAYAWRTALSADNKPSCIILSRQKFYQAGAPIVGSVENGGYVIYRGNSHRVRMTLIATGAEVPLAIAVARRLGRGVQVVSMPSVSRFKETSQEYKNKILRGRVIALEAGATPAWFELAQAVIGIDEFGTTGPGDMVYDEYGFDAEAIAKAIRNKIRNGRL